jgi:hypothetical protein
MEILRWTGQPGMALINRTRERDHAGEWRPVLEQFFNLVREFNAHHACFEDRMALLRGFGEIRDEWRGVMDRAMEAMRQEWQDRRRRAAAILADRLVEALTHLEKKPVTQERLNPEEESSLVRAYQDSLRRIEKRSRDEIEELYRHSGVDREDRGLPVSDDDLFHETSWRLFGLDRRQLARYGAAWGAVIGGGVDLMVGGLSFFTGALAGAGIGALTGWFGSTQVARTVGSRSKLARVLLPLETGRFYFQGPVTNPRFAWILLDRALVHFRAVLARSHARQDALQLDDAEPSGMVAHLPATLQSDLDRALRQVLSRALSGRASAATGRDLADAIRRTLDRIADAGTG